jgi:hypothetical protein
LGQARAGAEAARAEALDRHGAQLIHPRPLMRAAQRLADQPADVVELRIGRREQPVGAHGVERIEHATRPVGVEARGLTRFLGAGEALRGGVEPLLDGGEQFLRRFPFCRLSGAAHRTGSCASLAGGVAALIGSSASSAHRAAGEVQ